MSAKLELRERDFAATVILSMEHRGWRVFHHSDSRRQVRPHVFVGDRQARGFPDLLAVRADRLIAAELKVGRNRPSEAQLDWLSALSNVAEVYVWKPDDWPEIEAAIR